MKILRNVCLLPRSYNNLSSGIFVIHVYEVAEG